MKQCTGCKQYKPYSEFHRKTDTIDNRTQQCKTCCKAKSDKRRREKQEWTKNVFI